MVRQVCAWLVVVVLLLLPQWGQAQTAVPMPQSVPCNNAVNCFAGITYGVVVTLFGMQVWQWVDVEAPEGQPVSRRSTGSGVTQYSWLEGINTVPAQQIYVGDYGLSDQFIDNARRIVEYDIQGYTEGWWDWLGGDFGDGIIGYFPPLNFAETPGQGQWFYDLCANPCGGEEFYEPQNWLQWRSTLPYTYQVDGDRLPQNDVTFDSWRWRQIIDAGSNEYQLVSVTQEFQEKALAAPAPLPESRLESAYSSFTLTVGDYTERYVVPTVAFYVLRVPITYQMTARSQTASGQYVPDWCYRTGMSVEAYAELIFKVDLIWPDRPATGRVQFANASFMEYQLGAMHVRMAWPMEGNVRTWHGFLMSTGGQIAANIRSYAYVFDQAWARTCFGTLPVPVEFPGDGIYPWDEAGAPDYGIAARERDGKEVWWVVDPVSALLEAFVPQTPLSERFSRLSSALAVKFPFSVVSELRAPAVTNVNVVMECWDLVHMQICPNPALMTHISAISRAASGFLLMTAITLWLRNKLTPRPVI